MFAGDTTDAHRRWYCLGLAAASGLSIAMVAGIGEKGFDADPDKAERLSVEALQAKVAPTERFALGSVTIAPAGTLTWTALGPQPVANEYWSGNANASGRVSHVAFRPGTDGQTAYIGAAGGGVWKTTDGGSTWMPMTDLLSSLASGALAVVNDPDPTQPDTILYGTGEQHYSGDSLYGDGLFRSKDGGASWTKIAMKADVGSYIARVASSPGLLHVCSDKGYTRSTDDGMTWTAFMPGGWCNDLVRSASSATAAVGTWYAGFYATGVFKSADDGMTWSQLTGGLPSSGFQRVNLAISDSNPSTLYASFIAQDGSLAGMYKSVDAGMNWSQLASTPNYPCNQGWYDNTVAVSPTDPNTIFAGGVFPYCAAGGIVRSTNGGATWTNVTMGTGPSQVHPDQHHLTFAPDGTLWVGCDGGVWKSADLGGSWMNLNQGLNITQFYGVAFTSTDPTFLIAGTQDNGTVQFQGPSAVWPQVITGDGGQAAIDVANPNIYYTTYVQLSLLWKWLRPFSYQGEVTGPWNGQRADWGNAPVVADPNLVNTLVVGTYRVYESPTGGGTWNAISPDLTTGTGVLRALTVAPSDSNTIYSGSSDGQVYVTNDRGGSWFLRNAGLPGAAIDEIAINPADPQTAYIAVNQPSGGRFFRTSDGGNTWQDLTGSLPPGLRALSLAVDFAGNVAYLGTDYGVYSTPDGGGTWIQEAINLPSLAIYSLRIDPMNRLIYAASHGRGMWRAPLSGGPNTSSTTTAGAGG